MLCILEYYRELLKVIGVDNIGTEFVEPIFPSGGEFSAQHTQNYLSLNYTRDLNVSQQMTLWQKQSC